MDPTVNPSVPNRNIQQAGVQFEANPNIATGDHIKNTAAIIQTSAAHTYGNVAAVIEKYITDLFPQGLFKSVATTTTLASRQLKSLPRQLIKRELPLLVTSPRISFGQGDDRFLGGTLFNERKTNQFHVWGEGSLIELARDRMNRLWVHGAYNRAVMYIDVLMSFNTFMEQVNWMSFIHNMVPINHPFILPAPIELYLPRDFMALMSHLINIPTHDESGSVFDFMSHMNTIWHEMITYKLKGGSNSDEFFMYQLANLDVLFNEPTQNPGVKDGQLRRNFDISFTVRCDFNTIGYFTLNSPTLRDNIKITCTEDKVIVPIFTDVFNIHDFQLPQGWIVYSFPIFKLALNENTISFDSVLNNSLRAVIDQHLKLGIPMERFINIQFRENGRILDNEYHYIDWARRTLTVLRPHNHNTYRLLITVSPEYVNMMVKEIYQLE